MFYIFAGEDYYPCGGINDLIGSAASIDEAMEKLASGSYGWWHIVDSNLEVVRSS